MALPSEYAYDDAIDTDGLDVSREADMEELLKVDKEKWLNEVASIREHYAKLVTSCRQK